MQNYNPPDLDNLIIWTPKNTKEGFEHEKLLYYYPPSEDKERMVKLVGLSEALVNFTG